MSLSTNQVGAIAEAMLTAACIAAGYSVSVPVTPERYDLVLRDSAGRFSTVQVKSGRLRDGCVIFNAVSTSGRNLSTYDVDWFGVYCPELGACYLIPPTDLGASKGHLRVEPVRNGQSKRVRLAEPYQI